MHKALDEAGIAFARKQVGAAAAQAVDKYRGGDAPDSLEA